MTVLSRASQPLVVAVAVGMSLACVVIGRVTFPYLAFDPDSAAYLFQAKLFAQGMLAADAPPDFGFSPSPHINIHAGLWAAKYPFGNSLFLAPGFLLGFPWIMPAVATGITLLLFFDIVRNLFGTRVAWVALVLAAVSPTTTILGSSLFSQPTSRLAIALFLWALLRALRHDGAASSLFHAALAGLALGYGFNTRPAVAVVFGAAGLFLVAIRSTPWRGLGPLVLPAATCVLAFSVMFAMFLAWNAHFTGDPLSLPYHALQTADRMGFGLRGEGYAPFADDFRYDFTPAIALDRIWRHTIPCVLYNMEGWGAYLPDMFDFSKPDHRIPRRSILLLLPLLLVATPFVHRSRSLGDAFCGLVFLLTLGMLFFQYSDHSTWGWTPLHSGYYNEATLFGLIPLAARGTVILYDRVRQSRFPVARYGFIAIAVLLLAHSLSTTRQLMGTFRNWDRDYQHLPRLVEEAGAHNAVVFVRDSRNAPVGEFPFVPLEEADIVYFRTGPLPRWGLNTPDWRLAYEAYFSGRDAYLYEDGELTRVSVTPPRDN